MPYMTIMRTRIGWVISAVDAAGNDCRCHYIYTSRRAAEQMFRRDFGLKGRHFLRVVIP